MHDAREQERIAVGLGLGHELGADIAGGAGTILDHEGLTPSVAESLAVEARHQVDAAAWRKADQNANRSGRVAFFRLRRDARRCEGKERENKRAESEHGYLL